METLKTGFTYVIALVVLVGTGVLLVIPTTVPAGELLPFLTAVCGAVVAYVFAREQTQIVQAGNGIERTRLDEVSRQLSVLLLAQQPPGSPSTVTADRVDVAADEVHVAGDRAP